MLRVLIPVQLAFVVMPLAAELLASSAARAQEVGTPPASPAALSPVLQQMVDAINAMDSAALAALYIEDGIHEDIPAGVTARGREEITAFVDTSLGQFRDVRFEPVSGRQAGDLAVLEYTFSVIDRSTELPVTYRGILVFELDGILIRRSADYYDLATILGQLGQLRGDEPASEATPAL